MQLNEIMAQYLEQSARDLRNNMCGLSQTELINLASGIMHIELNKTQAAEALNMNLKMFDRKVSSGELPEGKHIQGQNNKIWYLDEILK